MALLLTRLKYALEDYTLTFCAETEAGEDEFMWGEWRQCSLPPSQPVFQAAQHPEN